MKVYGTILIIFGITYEVFLVIACLGGGHVTATGFGVGGFLILKGEWFRDHANTVRQRKVSARVKPRERPRANVTGPFEQMVPYTVEDAFAIFEYWLERKTALSIFLFSDQEPRRTRITAISRKEGSVSLELAENREVEINLKNGPLLYEPGGMSNQEHDKRRNFGSLLIIQFSPGRGQIVLAEKPATVGLVTITADEVSLFAQRSGFTRDEDIPVGHGGRDLVR